MKWPEAEAYVNRLRSQDREEIVRRQSPLLVGLALIMFLGGAGLLGYELAALAALIQGYLRLSRDPLVILDLLGAAPNSLLLFLEITPLAVAMILGSLVGMRQVWSSILFRDSTTD